MSKELSILQEIETRLKGTALGLIPAPSPLTVDRCRFLELAPTQLPHISVYPIEADTESKGYQGETHLTVKIVIWAKGASTPMDDVLDPLWLWVHQQIMTDTSLGGLAIRIVPVNRAWGFAIHQAPFGDLDCHYQITYRHNSNNPSI